MVWEVPHFTPTTPVVSVLMVTHDAERTVRRAIESVQNQTLKNFELVVVDAGSSDATARQIKAAAERDLRIETLYVDECSRQEGLDLALERSRGAYVVVMDPDGWARPTMLSSLVSRAREKSLDLVVGGFGLELVVAGQPGERTVAADDVTYPTQHEFRADAWRLFETGQLLPASAKLFSRELVESSGARFTSGLRDDHAFTIAALRDAERVGVCGGACYRIDRSARSAGAAEDLPKSFGDLEAEHGALLDLYRHWGLDGDAASMGMLQNRYVEQLVALVEEVCRPRGIVGGSEQRRAVARMLGTEHARLAVSVARPKSNRVRSMLVPMRAQNVAIVCAQARLLSLVRHGGGSDVPADVFV